MKFLLLILTLMFSLACSSTSEAKEEFAEFVSGLGSDEPMKSDDAEPVIPDVADVEVDADAPEVIVGIDGSGGSNGVDAVVDDTPEEVADADSAQDDVVEDLVLIEVDDDVSVSVPDFGSASTDVVVEALPGATRI